MQAVTIEDPQPPRMVDHALAILAKIPGARVFPVRVGAKFPPLICEWPARASADPKQVLAWFGRWPDANIGVTGLVVLDVDVRDGKPGAASFESLELTHEEVASTLIVNTPSGGKHVYVRQPDGARVSSTNGFRPGLDVKAEGGYVLGPGSRLAGFQQPYAIAQDMLPTACPETLLTLLRASPSYLKRADNDTLAPGAVIDDPVMIDKGSEWLRVEAPAAVQGQLGDETTFRVACELRDLGLSEPTAFDLMEEHYNPRCSPLWELPDLQAKVVSAWQSAQNQIGAKHPGAIRLAALADFAGVNVASPPQEQRSPLEHRLMRQGDALRHHTWLLKHLVPRIGTALLVAPSGAGKTSVAGQLAKSLATGEPFFGKAAKEKCGTLILAAEGLGGLQARLNVLSLDGGLPIYALPLLTLGTEAGFKGMIADIEVVAALCQAEHGLRLGLIIIDTLAASGLLTNENDNSECAAAIKKLERMALGAGCLVIATHHSPKVGIDPRGGSALGAGVDLILTVMRNGHAAVRTLQCSKGRDSREGILGRFTLIPEAVGIDDDGDGITACTVSLSNEIAPEGLSVRPLPSPDQITEIKGRIDDRAPDGHMWRFAWSSSDTGDNWAGVPIGEVMGFVAQASEERSAAQTILKDMIADGSLVKGDRNDPAAPKNAQRKPVPFVKLP